MNVKLNLCKAFGALSLLLMGALSSYAGDLRIGQQVYNTSRDAYATIIANSPDGTYVLRFDTGSSAGQVGHGWSRYSLAVLNGCARDLCTGTQIYNISMDAFATVAAIQYDSNYVLHFDTGSSAGSTGHGWSRSSLAVLLGCRSGFCVGQEVYVTSRDAYAVVAGIQYDSNFVIRFETGSSAGQYSHGWSRYDFSTLGNPGPNPWPQPDPVPVPQPDHLYVCHLITEFDQYSGQGWSVDDAASKARSACRDSEEENACNQGVVRCQ